MLNASQLMSTGANLFRSITNVFAKMGEAFTNSTDLYQGLQLVTIISFVIFIVAVAICIVLISKTYESRLLKHVSGFNRYFKNNPYINEDNLVEVNQKFKLHLN